MIDGTGFLYFSHDTKHAVRLVVSLFSLRKHWDGPVAIADTYQSRGIVDRILADGRLQVEALVRAPFRQLRRHSCYVAKSSVWRCTPFARGTIMLDCDTMFVRSPAGLVEIVEDERNAPVFVTRFSDWVTTGQLISKRLRQWDRVRCDGLNVRKLLKESLDSPHAAVNTGVVAWRAGELAAAEFLEDWERLAQAGARCSFTDELAAQLLLRKHKHTLLSERFNSSVLFSRERDREVIRHHHGSKHLRSEDGGLWLKHYEECLSLNIAGIREWTPAGDPALTEWMAARSHA
jgi:hypothetical protein